MVAIDPGAKHCGVATFYNSKCHWTDTLTPANLFTFLEETIEKVWVVEEWRSYPWKQQSFDPQLTAEVIGVIKYLAQKRNRRLFMQPAMIKKVTRGHLNHAGIELLPGTVHAQDAQLHGYHFIMKKGV